LSEVSIQPPGAGRYQIACPKCPATLVVTVHDGPGALPAVATLRADSSNPDAIPQGGPTLAGTPTPRPRPVAISAPSAEGPAVSGDDSVTSPFPVPRRLDGYRVESPAGPSRVGATFEATRRATGRPSRLVVVRPGWSSLATFLSRFAREAYAAEQLDHPNLLAPKDIGIDRGLAFAAFDAPSGFTLSDPRGREGFDRSARVAAILQAARALRHAHEQGIYHRDLSLVQIQGDGAGLIRLAGVGVNRTPETPEGPDAAPIPLAGSPPAPAPTGPVEAQTIRDDLAGLGRALQSLIGGERGDRATTPGLASVVRRLLGEGTEPPFADAGAAVRALEAELGVAGPFLPTEAEAADLEAAARGFDDAPLGRLRPLVSLGIAALLGAFAALALLAGHPLAAVGALAFGAIIGAATPPAPTRSWTAPESWFWAGPGATSRPSPSPC
jgi:serine/threonine protein kinase